MCVFFVSFRYISFLRQCRSSVAGHNVIGIRYLVESHIQQRVVFGVRRYEYDNNRHCVWVCVCLCQTNIDISIWVFSVMDVQMILHSVSFRFDILPCIKSIQFNEFSSILISL